MRLERLNDDQFRCILDQLDAEDKKLLDGVLFKDPKQLKKFFDDIINEAKKTLNFNIGSSSVTIESNFSRENEIEFIVSKSSPDEDISQLTSRILGKHYGKLQSNSAVAKKRALGVTAFEFKSLDTLYELINAKLPIGRLNNSLYKDTKSDTYILLVKPIVSNMKKYEDFVKCFEEFGAIMPSHRVSEAYFNDHYILIVKNNAIQSLQKDIL